MRIECNKPESVVRDSQRYDVFVTSSGCRIEYGPRRMRVVGRYTPADGVEFVSHIRGRNEKLEPTFPLVKKPQVRVLGIRLG